MASVSGQFSHVVDAEAPRWALAPQASRVDAIDQGLRNRLADSLRYLAEFADLNEQRGAALASLEGRLRSAPVSPFVFAIYSKLVAELSNNSCCDPLEIFDAIAEAAFAPAEEVIAFRDPSIAEDWWDQFRLLFDTDRKRPFNPKPPGAASYALCKEDLERGLALMRRADPVWHEEIRHLVRAIVLGSPLSLEAPDLFNGASTFFFWGGAFLNADIRRTAVSITDLLVHESSHGLLFGLSADGALTHNKGEERFASPLRSDARPIDGIFHACFVATRVHLAMGRLLESGRLTQEEASQAVQRRDFNGDAARVALGVLERHARPTGLGTTILDTISAYWAGVQESAPYGLR